MYNIDCNVSAANHNHKTYTKRVTGTDTGEEFWSLLEKLCEDLGCCENLFSTKPLSTVCQKCSRLRSGELYPHA